MNDLRRLEAAATPGPWRADVRIGMVAVYAGEPQDCLAAPHERFVYWKQGEWVDDHWTLDPADVADARLIVAARNALPALLDENDALRQERDRLREALEDMVNQFAYWSESDPPGQTTGGLSALEGAFAALGYDEPHPAEHLRCDEPGCRRQSSAGVPTLVGYRRTCHEHYPMAANDEWNAAWRAYAIEYPGAAYSDFVDSVRALAGEGGTDGR